MAVSGFNLIRASHERDRALTGQRSHFLQSIKGSRHGFTRFRRKGNSAVWRVQQALTGTGGREMGD